MKQSCHGNSGYQATIYNLPLEWRKAAMNIYPPSFAPLLVSICACWWRIRETIGEGWREDIKAPRLHIDQFFYTSESATVNDQRLDLVKPAFCTIHHVGSDEAS